MQVSPPKHGSARRESPALSSAAWRSACTTIPTSERIEVAATQVSPPKQMSSPPWRPSFCNSATLIARGKRNHITTSSEDCVVVAVRVLFFDFVDFELFFLVGIEVDSPFEPVVSQKLFFAS